MKPVRIKYSLPLILFVSFISLISSSINIKVNQDLKEGRINNFKLKNLEEKVKQNLNSTKRSDLLFEKNRKNIQ